MKRHMERDRKLMHPIELTNHESGPDNDDDESWHLVDMVIDLVDSDAIQTLQPDNADEEDLDTQDPRPAEDRDAHTQRNHN